VYVICGLIHFGKRKILTLFELVGLIGRSICQDNKSDWERTSTVMASIYANAYLTIAATGSDGDSHGFFVRRTPPDYVLFNYMVKDGTKGTLNAFLIPNSEAVFTNKYAGLEKEPLTKRGWALQERTLASRVLHSGTRQLYFECYQQFLAEDGFHYPGRFFSIHEDSGRAATNADGSPVVSSRGMRQYRGASKLWYDALYLYWPRRLTKSSDKLPALAGIARAIEEKTGDQYVAGLWRSEMIQGLV
jgi:hypothetical protein